MIYRMLKVASFKHLCLGLLTRKAIIKALSDISYAVFLSNFVL